VKLHGFFRSRTSHRLRIALNLKELRYEYAAVDLRRELHLGPASRWVRPPSPG
jgi:maleylpyruvate isomerase